MVWILDYKTNLKCISFNIISFLLNWGWIRKWLQFWLFIRITYDFVLHMFTSWHQMVSFVSGECSLHVWYLICHVFGCLPKVPHCVESSFRLSTVSVVSSSSCTGSSIPVWEWLQSSGDCSHALKGIKSAYPSGRPWECTWLECNDHPLCTCLMKCLQLELTCEA